VNPYFSPGAAGLEIEIRTDAEADEFRNPLPDDILAAFNGE
jgi:hypothetical protein